MVINYTWNKLRIYFPTLLTMVELNSQGIEVAKVFVLILQYNTSIIIYFINTFVGDQSHSKPTSRRS